MDDTGWARRLSGYATPDPIRALLLSDTIGPAAAATDRLRARPRRITGPDLTELHRLQEQEADRAATPRQRLAAKHKNAARKRRLWVRDRGRCHYCQQPMLIEQATRDHVVPRAAGGPNADWNIVLACQRCNADKDDWPGVCGCPFCAAAIAQVSGRQ